MKKTLFVTLIMLVLILVILLGLKLFLNYKTRDLLNNTYNLSQNNTNTENEISENTVGIFNGNTRPIAVMIDNVGEAKPQSGLNDAYLVYEMVVEGGLTRLMALYKDKEVESLGPVRSSRHYFLDYALENDAIYVHYGWSPTCKSDINLLNVDNINGINESTSSFWKVKDKSAPHNVVTSTEKILKIAERKGYSLISKKDSVLNYVTSEVELTNGIIARDISIPYTSSYKVTYKYNDESKRYTRGYDKTTQKDWITEELVTTKNIIITFAESTTLNDGTTTGRQDLLNIGTLKGYYITNGKAIEIECYKSSRTSQTIYRDLDGKEIDINDGNTFIQIVPINSKVSIK